MKVSLIVDNSGHTIGIVEQSKLAKAIASIESGTDLTSLDFTCITFTLNEIKPLNKTHVFSRAESLSEVEIKEETPGKINTK